MRHLRQNTIQQSNLLYRRFTSDEQGDISIMQWNALSDQLAVEFPQVPQEFLDWEYRWPLIMEEISNYDTDLVCLEEIDHFDDYFNPFMKERGFNGVFHKKGGWHWDGTCLFFRKSRFEMINYNVIKFKGTTQFALIVQLKDILKDLNIVIAVTHLKSQKPYEEVRQQQLREIIKNMQEYQSQFKHFIVLGDFNTTPNLESYSEMIQRGFTSAYYDKIVSQSEPHYTTYKFRQTLQRRTSDFIFLKGFESQAVLEIPSPQQIGESGLPSKSYPSDHVSLVAKLKII